MRRSLAGKWFSSARRRAERVRESRHRPGRCGEGRSVLGVLSFTPGPSARSLRPAGIAALAGAEDKVALVALPDALENACPHYLPAHVSAPLGRLDSIRHRARHRHFGRLVRVTGPFGSPVESPGKASCPTWIDPRSSPGRPSLRHASYHNGRLRRAPLPNLGHVAPMRLASGAYGVNRVGDQDRNADRDDDEEQPSDHVRLHPAAE